MLAKHPYHIITKPPHQGTCICVLSHLAEKVLVTGCLTIILVLVVETLTDNSYIPSIRMDNLPARLGPKSIEHSS